VQSAGYLIIKRRAEFILTPILLHLTIKNSDLGGYEKIILCTEQKLNYYIILLTSWRRTEEIGYEFKYG
jgi:hypothetical protein